MKKPNTFETLQPFSGSYSLTKDLKLNAWFLVATATYILTMLFRRNIADLETGWEVLLGLSPLVPAAFCVRSYVRFSRGMDELQRRLQLQAWLFASLVTVFIGAALSVLNAAGVTAAKFSHGLGFGGSYVSLFVFWLAWVVFSHRSYR